MIERNGHVGHGAVLHGCRIGADALVGMNAVVMDGAVIGACSIVGATAFVKAGFDCPPRSLVVGSPAQVKRSLSDAEVHWKQGGTGEYHALTRRCLEQMVECSLEPTRTGPQTCQRQYVPPEKPHGLKCRRQRWP